MNFDHVNLEQLGQEMIQLRRDFHKHPESGWTEFRTTARIIDELEKLGLTVQYGPSIHVREKMFGLPKEDVLEACWQRAMSETGRPDLVEAMKGGYTGCLTVIEGALPGPPVGPGLPLHPPQVHARLRPRRPRRHRRGGGQAAVRL